MWVGPGSTSASSKLTTDSTTVPASVSASAAMLITRHVSGSVPDVSTSTTAQRALLSAGVIVISQ